MKRAWFYLGIAALLPTAAACSIIAGVERPEPAGMGGAGGGGGTGDGGTGGEGTGGDNTGGGGGAGGGMEAPAWQAGEPDPATGTYTLPSWLVLESPSENKTVQVAEDRLLTGFGPHAARAHSLDGSAWGLAVESARTNRLNTTRIATPDWDVLNGTLAAVDGPAGDMMAAEVTDDSITQSSAAYEQFTPSDNAPVTLSTWVMTQENQASLECNSCDAPGTVFVEPMLGWHRVSLTTTEGMGGVSIIRLRPATPMANLTGATLFDFASVESGRYPTSVIITTGEPVTREAEKLYVPAAADLAPGGYFHVLMTFVPYYATGEQIGDHDLLFFDGMHRVYIRPDDNAIVLQAEGTDVIATPPLTWPRDRMLTVEVENTEEGPSLRVAGADEGEVVANDPNPIAFPVDGPIYILGNDTGAQESADLRSINFAP